MQTVFQFLKLELILMFINLMVNIKQLISSKKVKDPLIDFYLFYYYKNSRYNEQINIDLEDLNFNFAKK